MSGFKAYADARPTIGYRESERILHQRPWSWSRSRCWGRAVGDFFIQRETPGGSPYIGFGKMDLAVVYKDGL